MSNHISLPNVSISMSEQVKKSKAVQRYRGIYANLIAQYLLTDTIKSMSATNTCDDNILSNMLADVISTQASQRS